MPSADCSPTEATDSRGTHRRTQRPHGRDALREQLERLYVRGSQNAEVPMVKCCELALAKPLDKREHACVDHPERLISPRRGRRDIWRARAFSSIASAMIVESETPRRLASASSVSSDARLAPTVVRLPAVFTPRFMNHDSSGAGEVLHR
jgi:hypothetical protein